MNVKEEPGLLDVTVDETKAARVRQSGVDESARSLFDPEAKIGVVTEVVETVI